MAELEHVLVVVLRHGGLRIRDLYKWRSINTRWRWLVDAWLLASVHEPVLDPVWRSTQLAIPQERVANMALLALQCDLVPGTLVRALGASFSSEHRARLWQALAPLLGKILTPEHQRQMERNVTVGAPERLVYDASTAHRKAFFDAGNHQSARIHINVVEKCVNKDEKNNHSVALPLWLSSFTPHVHVSPLAVLIKPTKDPRLLFDASFQPAIQFPSLNQFVDMTGEWLISYGSAAADYYQWLWNLHISHPNEPIFQFFDDVQGTFKHISLHPDVVGAHAAQTPGSDLLMLNLSSVFGAQPAPCEFMICADTRAAAAPIIQRELIPGLLDPPYEFERDIPYIVLSAEIPFRQAEADPKNPGVILRNEDGSIKHRKPTPHHPFVDDTCLAEVRSEMPKAIHASLQALFMVFGYPDEQRPGSLNVRKFKAVSCSEVQTQLGIVVDSRRMEITLPAKKFERLRSVLTKVWHRRRRRFKPLEAAQLLGLLRHAVAVAWWGKYTFLALQAALSKAIRLECHRQQRNSVRVGPLEDLGPYERQWMMLITTTIHQHHSRRDLRVAFKLDWHKLQEAPFTTDMHSELDFLRHLFSLEEQPHWKVPIAQVVDRSPHATAHADASLHGLGFACEPLAIILSLTIPMRIQLRTLLYMSPEEARGNPAFVPINDLELASAIFAYAAVKCAILADDSPINSEWPVLRLFSDNVSAIAHLNKGSARSERSRALLRIYCCLAKGSKLSMNTEHVPGVDNILADKLSRNSAAILKQPLLILDHILRSFPQMRGAKLFLPSPELESLIWTALYNGELPGTPTPTMSRLTEQDANILGRFVLPEVWATHHSIDSHLRADATSS